MQKVLQARCFSVRSNNKPIIFDVVDKSGAGTVLAKDDTNEFASGEKQELPSIIDKNCVDIYNYGKDFVKLLNAIRKQNYNAAERLVLFLSDNRHAPVDVISTMTGLSTEEINSILNKEKQIWKQSRYIVDNTTRMIVQIYLQ